MRNIRLLAMAIISLGSMHVYASLTADMCRNPAIAARLVTQCREVLCTKGTAIEKSSAVCRAWKTSQTMASHQSSAAALLKLKGDKGVSSQPQVHIVKSVNRLNSGAAGNIGGKSVRQVKVYEKANDNVLKANVRISAVSKAANGTRIRTKAIKAAAQVRGQVNTKLLADLQSNTVGSSTPSLAVIAPSANIKLKNNKLNKFEAALIKPAKPQILVKQLPAVKAAVLEAQPAIKIRQPASVGSQLIKTKAASALQISPVLKSIQRKPVLVKSAKLIGN